ncbi:MAG: GAF domain-containing protein [Thermodesulfobacteriota bacterium]
MAVCTDYFGTLCTVSKALGTTLSKDEILGLIVRSAIDTMDAKAACLFLADEDRDIFLPVAQQGLSEHYLHGKPMQARTVVANILQGGYLAIKDATSDPRLEHHDLKKAEGITSILVVPVMVKDKAIGVLSLYSKDFKEFAPDEIAFLTALAEQGGMAIENARLFDRLNRNTRLFYELASHLNSSLDIKQIMHILTKRMAEALEMKGVCVRLLNKDTGSLELMAGCGLSAQYLATGITAMGNVVGEVLAGRTVVIRDVAHDPLVIEKDVVLKEGIAALLAVPIRSGDDVIGLMMLDSEKKEEFPEDTVMLVNALAHQGGQAIRNASLYLLLDQAKKSLEEDIWSHKSWF